MTGQVINKLAATSPVAGNTVKAGGFTWAYRTAEPDASKAKGDAPEVLLLHGIGSSSYSYRNTVGLLGGEGYRAYAPDWLGHGDSDKPSGFPYTEAAFLEGLEAFIAAVGIKKPFALVVQGYILGQYGLLYALEHPDQISRLMVLNMPLALSSKLRPELAPYKAPLAFMRPGNKPFDAQMYAMMGSPYAMAERDVLVYGRPYKEEPAASAAISKTMDQVDFPKLLSRVDEGCRTWRKPSVVLFGANDPFCDVGGAFQFLENKRTNMKMLSVAVKLGHMPQEDYPEAVHEMMVPWLTGETDSFDPKMQTQLRMTKKGVTQAKA